MRFYLVSAMLLCSVGLQAQDAAETKDAPETSVMVELVDGSRIRGVPQASVLPIKLSFANLQVPVTKVDTLEFRTDRKEAVLHLLNGDRLTGAIGIQEFPFTTVLGPLCAGLQHIHRIQFHHGQLGVPGLVLYLPFDSDGGERSSDKSGKGNHGTVHGAKWVAQGKVGGGCSFDGQNDSISVKDSESLRPEQVTICVWVKASSLSPYHCIVGKMTASSWHGGYGITHNNGAADVSFFVNHYGQFLSGGTLATGVWTHLAGVFDGRQVLLYVNGEPQEALPHATPLKHVNGPLLIGDRNGGTSHNYLHGLVDEVMVFNRPLSAQEIARIYRQQK